MQNIIIDEFHHLVDTRSSKLTEELRGIEGIPDTVYHVDGDKVFVFNKLISLMKSIELPKAPAERKKALRVIAHELLPLAYVSAIDAVTTWGITPTGYIIVERDSCFLVKNTVLKSIIPKAVSSVEEAQSLIADVLINKRVPTFYDDLIDSGKVLTQTTTKILAVCDRTGKHAQVTTEPSSIFPFGDQIFENAPNGRDEFYFSIPETGSFFPFDISASAEAGVTGFTLSAARDGCLLVSRDHYAHMVKNATQWFSDGEYAADIASKYYSNKQTWQSLFSVFVSEITDGSSCCELDNDDNISLSAIRRDFPELSVMSDHFVYETYGDYRRTEHHLRSIDESDVYRDEGFLFYCFGEICQCRLNSEQRLQDSVAVGAVGAYFASLGYSVENVKLMAKNYVELTQKIQRVMWDCKRLFDYIYEVNSQGGKIISGERVTTIGDYFYRMRKVSIITQSLSDFTYTSK